MKNHLIIAITLLLSATTFAKKVDSVKVELMNLFPEKKTSLTKLSKDDKGLLFIQTYWACKEEAIDISSKKKTITIGQKECGSETYTIDGFKKISNTRVILHIELDSKSDDDSLSTITIDINDDDKERIFYTFSSSTFEIANGIFVTAKTSKEYEIYCLDCEDEKQERLYDEIQELYE